MKKQSNEEEQSRTKLLVKGSRDGQNDGHSTSMQDGPIQSSPLQSSYRPSSSENILPGPSGLNFNHLKLNYIEVNDDEDDLSDDCDQIYSDSRHMMDGLDSECRANNNEHLPQGNRTYRFQDDCDSMDNGIRICIGLYDGDDIDLSTQVFCEGINGLQQGHSVAISEDGEGLDDGEQLEEQLTITSNGSKMSALSKKSTTSLLKKSNDKLHSKPWLKRKDGPDRSSEEDDLMRSTESQSVHLNSQPHTITCRPMSESSSVAQLSLSSSFISNSDSNAPMCKICHLHGKDSDPLISPCKCSGTMQYIHCGCLMRWLEISSKKSRKPLSCELCQYQYHWHKKFKVNHWQFPHVSRRDKLLHVLFFLSVSLMFTCAIITVMCFKHERGQRIDPNRTELTQSEIVTLICGVLFFLSFFIAMYVEVKARNTLYKLCVKFIYLNQQWYIDEYETDNGSGFCRKENLNIEPVQV